MKKLFIFQRNSDLDYSRELSCGFTKCEESSRRIGLNDLSLNHVIDNSIDVVISNGLPKEWYFMFKGLNIVTITIDELGRYHDLADIVIDHKSENSSRYFTGKDYSLFRNSGLSFDEIVNLITILKWDSAFWGFPVAYLSSRHLTDNIILRIDKFIKRSNIRLVEYLCNCHDNRSVKIAEKNGFHFTDIRLSFEKALLTRYDSDIVAPYSVRMAKKKNIQQLQTMSEDLYRNSRYFFDENFDRKKVNEFYRSWVEKAVMGKFDDECYCLYDEDLPIGLCTIRYSLPQTANIGLFGLSNKYQGKGLGRKLLFSTLNILVEKNIKMVYVVTQGRNYLAQRLYQSAGFMTKSTELWYHKWL